ncbi:MAG: bifunctional DNA-formamidopyrimidine glycosylase/DNA-(apurinic or apyrimidinic site) lyase [Magnetococcales bacterium]|nr:bifunctional DNA-formamidopyrimidine glycosylase/DNA-(apurinic or apyrimidinic site) lyase [Magnetococcales bacterium]
MPELPEVETVCRGLAPHLLGNKVTKMVARRASLRWPIPIKELKQSFLGKEIVALRRRGKYLLMGVEGGWALFHLGMSGHLRVEERTIKPRKHDHVDLHLSPGEDLLRFNDTRRFGALLWIPEAEPERHVLLSPLGPEPLGEMFTGRYLHGRAKARRLAVKNFIMDGRVVVGVGNIYASESLYMAGIHPETATGALSLSQCVRLVEAIREILAQAIEKGGTTLRDFRNGEGKPGYFQQVLAVYGRQGEPCRQCGAEIQTLRLGQRSSFFCPGCQPASGHG